MGTDFGSWRWRVLLRAVASVAIVGLGMSCSSGGDTERGPVEGEAGGSGEIPGLSEAALMERIRVMSADDFGGRAPGSEGEKKTVDYLRDQFKDLGLTPGNPDGTWVQEVPLVGITATATDVRLDGSALEASRDVVAWTKRVVDSVTTEGELVFVGYGVDAAEYDWNDYKDADLSGKILLMLVNDPPVEALFGGEAMTYYGRWTYKYEIAAAKGAAGAFIVHETGPAGYPWEVVTGSWMGEQFDLETEDRNMARLQVEGWLSNDTVRSLLVGSGNDLDALKAQATQKDFQPVPLGVSLSAEIHNSFRATASNNVVARIAGSQRPDETVIYVAHWDHLGTVDGIEGDNIFNGAFDNATGTAGLLALAQAFKATAAPERSLLFLAVTAEEQGLLGSRYYAEHPLYPTKSTVAAVNMDGLNVWGRTKDFTVVGLGQSELDEVARSVVSAQDRVLRPDPEPEKGFYYRSDHFEFAKVGIPAFYGDSGVDFIGKPDGWGIEQRDKYNAEDYHKPSDEVKDWYDLSGMIEDLTLFYEMGRRLVDSTDWPSWSPSSEFRAVRDKDRPHGE